MCVHATLMRQTTDAGARLVLHLFNDINTTAFHALPNDDVPLREETIPIGGIQVTFRRGYQFSSIRLEPEGLDLEVHESDEGTAVIVPRLEVHSMVVGELTANDGS